jgi:FAD/FMN-containing dehydrogenase
MKSLSSHFVWMVEASLLSTGLASTLVNVQQACTDIKNLTPTKLFYPNDKAYGLENTDYYNIGLAELKPACIFQPTTAEEVSSAIKILNKYNDVPFAVKSGGHDPNPGHSSIKDGILIALSKMTFVSYDKKSNTAQFGPGGHWNTLIKPLDKQGVTVVGGRLG